MTKESFYDILKNGNFTREQFSRLTFQKDFTGPKFNIIPGENYEKISDAIANGDYKLNIFSPINKEITDPSVKKNLLEQLFYNPKRI